eukprot:89928_1
MKGIIKGQVSRTTDQLSRHLKALRSDDNIEKRNHAPSKLCVDLEQIHLFCYGDVDKQPNPENAEKLVKKLLDSKENLFLKLAENMAYLPFEAKKRNADILNYVIRRCVKNRSHVYIQCKTDRNGYNPIIQALLDDYNQNSSSVIQEMVKRPELTNMLLNQIKFKIDGHNNKSTKPTENKNDDNDQDDYDLVDELLVLVENPIFHISSDAFRSLETLLIRGQKKYTSNYLNKHYHRIFQGLNKLIKSDHFVTQKKTFVFLRELLVKNRDVMIKYVANKANLAMIMNLMHRNRDNSVSFEAFHIFKMFVANPRKQKDVHMILW